MGEQAFKDLFGNYRNSITNFNKFHNQIINMPRANFSEIDETVKLMRSLSSYIMLIDNSKISEPLLPKEIYRNLFINFKLGLKPKDEYRNIEFEENYFNRSDDFDFLYSDEGKMGRMFRHYMDYFLFFQLFSNSDFSKKKIVDTEALEEIILLPDNVVVDNFRNRLLNWNIKNNDFIKNTRGIELEPNADYRPAHAILKYLYEINRPATLFEISILFGRVGDIQNEEEIILKSLLINELLPETREEQIKFIFYKMGWSSSEDLYEYSQSQNPDFKFKPFILFMNSLGMINFDNSTSTMVLTTYSEELMKEDIPIEVLDLQNLIARIDDETEDYNRLLDLILRKRTDTITEAIRSDGELVFKMNKRNIKYPIIKNGKRVRNRVITELAKIKANYTDEVSGGITFEGKNGMNYVEAHHIIEFNGEDGPDITDNLICLNPINHTLIHRGSASAVKDFYITSQTRGAITFDRFKDICVKYQCLTKDHVNILLAKGLVSKMDATELNNLIDIHGVDEDFLSSINY